MRWTPQTLSHSSRTRRNMVPAAAVAVCAPFSICSHTPMKIKFRFTPVTMSYLILAQGRCSVHFKQPRRSGPACGCPLPHAIMAEALPHRAARPSPTTTTQQCGISTAQADTGRAQGSADPVTANNCVQFVTLATQSPENWEKHSESSLRVAAIAIEPGQRGVSQKQE